MYCFNFYFLTFCYYSIDEIDDRADEAVFMTFWLFACALDFDADSNIVLVVTLDLDLLPLKSLGDESEIKLLVSKL